MKLSYYIQYSLCLLILLFPGCKRYGDWGRSHFITTDKYNDKSILKIRDIDVKFTPMEDSLMTIALPRIMYLSQEVIDLHDNLREERGGLVEESEHLKNKKIKIDPLKNTMFYVSLYEDKEDWAFALIKDKNIYSVKKIKAVDMDQEYQQIFGKSATKYKQNIYSVIFENKVRKPFDLKLSYKEYKKTVTFK